MAAASIAHTRRGRPCGPRVTIICANCNHPFMVLPSAATRYRYCSMACHSAGTQGPGNPHWKGGRHDRNGYVVVFAPDHPAQVGSYVREHRLVMEQILGRFLESHELVHHINGIKNDNRPENLALVESVSAHVAHHYPLNTATQRQCSKCKIIKPLTREFFGANKRVKYGFSYRCRMCEQERWQHDHRDRHRRS